MGPDDYPHFLGSWTQVEIKAAFKALLYEIIIGRNLSECFVFLGNEVVSSLPWFITLSFPITQLE